MPDMIIGDRHSEPAGNTDLGWHHLTPEQQAGMTRDYWERELDGVTRAGLTGIACSHRDCSATRWDEVGSFYCETHARVLAVTVAPR